MIRITVVTHMSFDPEYEEFLGNHKDGDVVFTYRDCDYRLKTREGLFQKENINGMSVPFISCLVAFRKSLTQSAYSDDEVETIDGMAIGEYSGDILFISHLTDAVCVFYADGTADVEEIAPSIGEFLARLKRK